MQSARQSAARGVDLLQVDINYEIGRRIFEHEQKGADRAGYGKELLNELAGRLTNEFGNGFSRTNLASMRQFSWPSRAGSEDYPDRVRTIRTFPIPQTGSKRLPPSPIVQTLSGQFTDQTTASHQPFLLNWSHYVFLIGLRTEERDFHEISRNGPGPFTLSTH